MSTAYFDCFSGVAGDMVLGSLVDAGMPLKHLRSELAKVELGDYSVELYKRVRGVRGADIKVVVKEEIHGSHYTDLDEMIETSRLSKGVKDLSREILHKLAEAEARVHGTSVEKVHFHEVGATDSIVDIVGAAIGFEFFKFDSIHASPLPLSRGKIECAHGTLPAPAPATLELMKDIPLEKTRIKGELVTPTGAAILATVVESFGECPLQSISKVGYGFGDREIPGVINALRLMIGDGFRAIVIQTNIDDMNPEHFDHVMDLLFKAGAVDVDLAAVQMKKNRPGIKLSALAPYERRDAVIDVMLRETTTFGVRYTPVERRMLSRNLVTKKAKCGDVRFKVGCDSNGKIVKAVPEYEDVRKLAKESGRPIYEVYNELLIQAKKISDKS